MPTYSYRCTQCESAFDIHQAFTDATLTDCPSCDGRLRKVFSSIGVTFNGSGFYRNDSRASGKGATDAKSAASTSTSGSSASSGGEKASGGASSGSSAGSSSSGSSSSSTAKATSAS